MSLAVCLCWELGYIAVEGVYKVPEKAVMHTSQPMDHTLTKGVYKGIKTTASMEWFYESTLSDLDIIRADPDCAVAVLEFAPFAYFYLDRPYAAYSPVFYGGEIGRLSAYWKLPHTRKPDYIYLPYYNYTLFMRYDETILNDMLQRVLLYVDGDVTRGKAGFIISVNGVL